MRVQPNNTTVQRQLVPTLLTWMHDNPEGRDVCCMWTSNSTEQEGPGERHLTHSV